MTKGVIKLKKAEDVKKEAEEELDPEKAVKLLDKEKNRSII